MDPIGRQSSFPFPQKVWSRIFYFSDPKSLFSFAQAGKSCSEIIRRQVQEIKKTYGQYVFQKQLIEVVKVASLQNEKLTLGTQKAIGIFDLNLGRYVLKLQCRRHHPSILININERVVTGSNSGTIRFWNFETQERITVCAHTDVVTGLVCVDDATLYSSSNDGTIKKWNIKTKECESTFKNEKGIKGLIFEENRLFFGSEKEIKIWHLASNTITILCSHEFSITTLIYTNGKILTGSDETIRSWDAVSGECEHLLQGHRGYILSLICVENKLFSTSSEDSSIKIWNLKSYQLEKIIETKQIVTGFHCHVNTLISFSKINMKIWQLDLPKQELVKYLCKPSENFSLNSKDNRFIQSFQQNKMNQVLTEASGQGSLRQYFSEKIILEKKGDIKIWDLKSKKFEATLCGHTSEVIVILYVDGLLFSGSCDHKIKVWNLKTGVCLNTLCEHTDHITSLAYFNGKLISGSGCQDSTIKIWDWRSGRSLKTLEGHKFSTRALICVNGKLISGSQDGFIKVWNLETHMCEKTIDAHDRRINSFIHVKNKLITASDDCKIKIWNLENWTCEKTLIGHTREITAICYVEDKLISSSWDRTLRIWNLNGICEKVIQNQTDISHMFYENGRLVTGDLWEKEIKIWEPAVGENVL